MQDDIRANLESRQRLRGKSPLLPTGDDAANNAAIQGLIEKQKKLIKDLQTRQAAATQENQGKGADFLFGKGGLNLALVAAQKELDRLEGKVDKSIKSRSDKLAAALRALEQERVTLASLASKASVKAADDLRQRAAAQLSDDLRGIELVKQKLIDREKAVRKAGGRGANADGTIDGVQAAQLNALRRQAEQKYADELFKIQQQEYDQLLNLQADSNAKELEQLERKYEKEKLAAAGQSAVLLAIEDERQRAILALRARQEDQRIAQQATLGRNNAATVGQTFGAGTGVSVFEAARAEKRLLLDIEKKAAQDSLNNTLNKVGKEAEIERTALRAQLSRIKQQSKDLDSEEKASQFSIYKLVLGENDSPELRKALDDVATSVAQSLSAITQSQQQAAAARAGTATTAIGELSAQLTAEVALRKDGAASNIQTIQREIEEQKRIRREALADQRRAAQQQVIIDTLTQASNIATAASETFAAFANIPVVGVPLGVAAVGLLIGAFAASKVQAYNAASQIGKGGPGFFKGGYTGGSDVREERGPVHGKEFVFDNKATAEHRPFFELLHAGKPLAWADPALDSIRPLIQPDPALPGKMQAARAAVGQMQVNHTFAPLQAGLDKMESRLAAIEAHTKTTASKPATVAMAPGVVLDLYPNGSTHERHFEGLKPE